MDNTTPKEASDTAPVSPSTNTPPTVKQLQDIPAIDDKDLMEAYTSSLQVIHQYNSADIQEVLLKLSMDTLANIHKRLCEMTVEMFPALKEKRAINRQVKKTIVPDIFNLGYSLSNKAPTRELEKIFVTRDSTETTTNVTPANPNADMAPVSTNVADPHDLLKIVITLRDRITALEKAQAKLDAENKSLKSEIAILASATPPRTQSDPDVTRLSNKLSELSDLLAKTRWENFRTQNTLLLGDSLIRDVDPHKLSKTKVISISGGKVTDASDKLLNLQNFRSIVLCIGTNNCSDPNMDIDQVTQSYRVLCQAAIDRVPFPTDVTISSIPPRVDSPDHRERVSALNASLCALATDLGVLYIDNDPKFTLKDNSPNDGYLLEDGLHLSPKGTNVLVKNLMIEVNPNTDGDVTKAPEHTQPRSKPSTSKREPSSSMPKPRSSMPKPSSSRTDHTRSHPDRVRSPSGPGPRSRPQTSRSQSGHNRSRQEPSRSRPEPSRFRPDPSRTRTRHNRSRPHSSRSRPEPSRPTPHHSNPMPEHSRPDSSETWEVVHHRNPRRTHNQGQQHGCHYCGESNHVSRNCRHGQAVTCHTCGTKGHKQKFCKSC